MGWGEVGRGLRRVGISPTSNQASHKGCVFWVMGGDGGTLASLKENVVSGLAAG